MDDYNNQYYQPTQNPNQPPQYQPQYQQPVYQPYDPTTQVMSIGSYIGMIILSALPLVNLICWIVWLVSPNTNKNKKNFIWAQIIVTVAIYLVSIVSVFVLAGAGVSLLDYAAIFSLF